MSDEIPQWARNEAVRLAVQAGMPNDGGSHPNGPYTAPLVDAFAHYIAEHEEPPVDPLVEALRSSVSDPEQFATRLRVRLAERGLEIRETSK